MTDDGPEIWLFEPPLPTSYGYKRIFAIEQNLAAMIGRWPIENLLVVTRTCKVPQPGPIDFLNYEVEEDEVCGWYPPSVFHPPATWKEDEWAEWLTTVEKCQRRIWRKFLAELRDIFKQPSPRNPYRLGDKVAEWLRVVEFRWYHPGRLKPNSIHSHELWAMCDPIGLGFDHKQHQLWRKAEKLRDFQAARRHMMARNPSEELLEVWQLLAHAKEAYGLHGRFDCFPAYIDPRYEDGTGALIGYFTKYLSGKDLVHETGSDWKGKQIIPENAKGLRIWSTARDFSKRATTNFAWNGTKSRLNRARMARLAEILKLENTDQFKALFGQRYRWWLQEVVSSVNVLDRCPEGLWDHRPDQILEAVQRRFEVGDVDSKRLLFWPPRPNRSVSGWPNPNRSREGWNFLVLVKALAGVWSEPGSFSVPERYGLSALPFRYEWIEFQGEPSPEQLANLEQTLVMLEVIERGPLTGESPQSERSDPLP